MNNRPDYSMNTEDNYPWQTEQMLSIHGIVYHKQTSAEPDLKKTIITITQ